MRIKDLSRLAHDSLFRDKSQSLCSRAYERQDETFWRLWVCVFGLKHCRKSWQHYHGGKYE